MQEDSGHGDDCLLTRLLGVVRAGQDTVLHVHHVSCAREPHRMGGVGMQVIVGAEVEQDETEQDRPQADGGEADEDPGRRATGVILRIDEALLLANRLVRACNVAMEAGEAPQDADFELARILAQDDATA